MWKYSSRKLSKEPCETVPISTICETFSILLYYFLAYLLLELTSYTRIEHWSGRTTQAIALKIIIEILPIGEIICEPYPTIDIDVIMKK